MFVDKIVFDLTKCKNGLVVLTEGQIWLQTVVYN